MLDFLSNKFKLPFLKDIKGLITKEKIYWMPSIKNQDIEKYRIRKDTSQKYD